MGYSPVFTVTVMEGENKGKLVVVDAFSAISATKPDYVVDSNKAVSLADALSVGKRNMAPVVVFAEATTSNGKALLPFEAPIKGLETLSSSLKLDRESILVLAFRSPIESGFSPSFVVGSQSTHFLTLLMQVNNSLEVLRLSSSDLPPFSSESTDNTEEWAERLRKTVAAMMGVKCVSVGVETKREFAKAWESDRHGHAN